MNTDSSTVNFADEVQKQSTGESMYTLVYNEKTGQFEQVLKSDIEKTSKTPVNIPGLIWAQQF